MHQLARVLLDVNAGYAYPFAILNLAYFYEQTSGDKVGAYEGGVRL